MNYRLSPSSFSFLYEGCKRCFYLDVVHFIKQPSMPLPGVFSKIAGLLKTHYDGKTTGIIHPDLPPGIISHGEKFVRSKIIKSSRHRNSCYISGRFDIAMTFDDKSYGVIDFKTGTPNPEHNHLYQRQLQAYAFALENPSSGALKLAPVSKIGLLYFPPIKTHQNDISKLLYETDIHWLDLERNDKDFFKFIGEVLDILESPEPPAPDQNCLWCNYINKVDKLKKEKR